MPTCANITSRCVFHHEAVVASNIATKQLGSSIQAQLKDQYPDSDSENEDEYSEDIDIQTVTATSRKHCQSRALAKE